MLTSEELADLKDRCNYAKQHGFQIGNAEQYATDLGYAGEDPPPKVKKFSPAHLLHLMGDTDAAPPSKFKKAGKAAKAAAKKQEDIPTVPVDPSVVKAAADAMRKNDDEET